MACRSRWKSRAGYAEKTGSARRPSTMGEEGRLGPKPAHSAEGAEGSVPREQLGCGCSFRCDPSTPLAGATLGTVWPDTGGKNRGNPGYIRDRPNVAYRPGQSGRAAPKRLISPPNGRSAES